MQTGDGLREGLDRSLRILFVFFLVVSFEQVFGLIVLFERLLLFGDLLLVLGRFFFLCFGL